VNDQSAGPGPVALARVSRYRRVFVRFAGVLVGLIGLLALVIGGVLLASQRWPLVQATPQSCQSHTSTSGTGSQRHRSTTTDCVLTWDDSTGTHTAMVGFNGGAPKTPTVAIRVHGGTAVEATPGWLGWTTLAVGFALAGIGVLTLLPSRRRAG
jgi:hypothetical protein